MRLVLLGAPGSGKGTQAQRMQARHGVPQVSTGDLLREAVARGTPLGRAAKAVMDAGQLVADDVMLGIIRERLAQPDAARGFILDGFPRTIAQADSLDNIMHQTGRKLAHVVYLNVSDDEAMKRLSGRRVCTNTKCERNYHLSYHPPQKAGYCDRCGSAITLRKDDTPEAIAHRLSLYHSETAPLIALYQGQGLLREIDGQRTIADVQADILKAVGKG